MHGNLEALEAVLQDMATHEVAQIICLGDIVGYGPNPAECLTIIRKLEIPTVLGNHDEACLEPRLDHMMNDYARAGIAYSRRKLTYAQKKWLGKLPHIIDADTFTLVHSSLDEEEIWPYVLDRVDAAHHFQYQDRPIAFCGHTHSPAVWKWEHEKVRSILPRKSVPLGPARYLINVGSVGQPRNRNSNASYVLFDPETRKVEFQSVPYDYQATQRKIIDAGLPPFLAVRLELGR